FTTTWERDNLERVTRVLDNLGNQRRQQYDSLDDLVAALDARGNEVRFAHDGLHRLLSATRLMTDTGDGTGVVVDNIVTTQQWDDSSKVVAQTDRRGNVTRCAHDAHGRPIVTQTADGVITQVGTGASWPLGFPQPDLSGF